MNNTMKLKVYRGISYNAKTPLRGSESLVATTSQKRGAEIAGVSLHHFREFWGETGNSDDIDQAMKEPHQLLTANENNNEKR